MLRFCLIWFFLGMVSLMAFEIDSQGMCRIEKDNYPAVGFGTYPFKGEVCAQAVEKAFRSGYRIFDTATFYENFVPIGEVIKRNGRGNFYLISKVWPDAHTGARLRHDLKITLQQLQTDYIDAYLLHWPNSSIPLEDTFYALEKLRKQGRIRHIGLSNVTVNHLKRALELKVPISWVQVEMNPSFCDFELLKFCHEKGITIQAWAPLARGSLSDDPLLSQIGEKYGKKASQVAIRWIMQHGCIPLPASKNEHHIRQNFTVNDFELSQQEMDAIDARAKNGSRERVTAEMNVGFVDEFDFTYEQCWPKRKLSNK